MHNKYLIIQVVPYEGTYPIISCDDLESAIKMAKKLNEICNESHRIIDLEKLKELHSKGFESWCSIIYRRAEIEYD